MNDTEKIRKLAQLIGDLQGDNDAIILSIKLKNTTLSKIRKLLLKNKDQYINRFNKIIEA